MRSLGVHSLGAQLSSLKPNSFSVIVRSSSGSRITLRKFDDFLGDKSCLRIVTNFEVQSLTRCSEGSGHGLNDLRVKRLSSKIWGDRHDCAPVAVKGGSALCLSVTDARILLVCSMPVMQPASP
jgi:hypothetical protein